MLESAKQKSMLNQTCKSTKTMELKIVRLALANVAEQAVRMIQEKKEKDLKTSLVKLDKKLIELLGVSFEKN
jgi:ribosomal protein L31E